MTVHRALLERLGVKKLLAAIGGSLGGMQVLQWAIDHPDEIDGAVIVAASARLTAQNIAFSAVAREAIMRDPDFNEGDYYETDSRPDRGLALARMIGHITYLSEESMREKFGRRIQDAEVPRYGFDVDFQVESYLHYQGQSFVERFDANTYLYLGRVMDYFDPFADPVRTIEQIGSGETNFLVLSFDSDWRFSTEREGSSVTARWQKWIARSACPRSRSTAPMSAARSASLGERWIALRRETSAWANWPRS